MALLDIDGVINVFQCANAREVQVAPYLPAIRMLPDSLQALRLLHEAFWLVWCSSWGQLANLDAAAQWGLDPRPWIAPNAEEAARPDWKILAVARTFRDWPGPIAWIEDGFRAAARRWASDRLASGSATRLVDVTENGLTLPLAADLVEWSQRV